jgi:hypothetical protein
LSFADDDDRAWLEQRISIEALNVTVGQALVRVTVALGGAPTTIRGGVCHLMEKKESPQAARVRAQAVAQARARTAGAARRAAGTTSTRSTSASALSTSPSGEYVGKISIPMDGGRYFIEFMLRESDLTDELRQLRAERIKAILEPKPTAEPVGETPGR